MLRTVVITVNRMLRTVVVTVMTQRVRVTHRTAAAAALAAAAATMSITTVAPAAPAANRRRLRQTPYVGQHRLLRRSLLLPLHCARTCAVR